MPVPPVIAPPGVKATTAWTGVSASWPSRICRAAAAGLLWLPGGFHLGLVLAGGVGLATDAAGWLQMAALAAGGVPLALACMLLWRRGRRRAACAAFAVLGPGAVAGTLALEGFGPFAVATVAAAASLPAWLMCARRSRERGLDA